MIPRPETPLETVYNRYSAGGVDYVHTYFHERWLFYLVVLSIEDQGGTKVGSQVKSKQGKRTTSVPVERD